MNVLLIGSGGREHALAWKLISSPLLGEFHCAPGNAGICEIAQCADIDISAHGKIIAFCRSNDIGLVVVGPEAPLVAGLVDDLNEAGFKAFGPTAEAAQLEGSKAFTHEICDMYAIPTAHYASFNNATKAKTYLRECEMPVVVKADGLAAGKGVVIAKTIEQAIDAVDACFEGEFGDAGQRVVIEEFLEGEEISLFAICDGQVASLIGTAQDHKRVFDGDSGPNTGGMGAYCPASIIDQPIIDKAMSEIIVPTLAGMHARGTPFKGILYAGLMLTPEGPKLIEYNVRFGDPECQVLMMRLKSDLLELMLTTVDGSLLEHEIEWHDLSAISVVMATKGYPDKYENGSAIRGKLNYDDEAPVKIFHAGTAKHNEKIVAVGGRVLNVTATGCSLLDAQQLAYDGIKAIDWPEGFWRSDIGWREIERENGR
ncbi:MAG: phosphoribosylamine--glycine ligase [Rhizobiaceae bacterium]|nr:phosphoribosylamine--glycine ligase [Rhizobiaceae bacterium]